MTDADGDGVYTLEVPSLPVGSYEYKVALNRGWSESYPAANLSFSIVAPDNVITFYFDSTSREVSASISGSRPPGAGGDIFWDGLAHNSRDTLYRAPAGAIASDTPLTLRFRTFYKDVTAVTLRTYHTGTSTERLYAMKRAAEDVSCYDPDLQFNCDLWETTLNAGDTGTLYYRFIVRDGPRTVYYEDDSDVRDGGWGKAFDQSPDWGWAVTVYDPAFSLPIRWMQQGVVYQIFPDRFANADPSNDPTPVPEKQHLSRDPRYSYPSGDPGSVSQPEWDQIVRMQWGELPEGYCRNYQGIGAAACAARFDQPRSEREQPRGRDYYGGDLAGV
ncbi:MAG: alpha-amylase, partial [Chloroflexota bacterium]|nr:alpha-amylase [Chloroflexota bacterium]